MAINNNPKKIGCFILPHSRPQYQIQFSKTIQEVLYGEHSLKKVITQDVLCFAESKERLKCYRPTHQNAYRLFIQLAGKYFSVSPNEKKTELPLMILTDTKSIFLRRIKRLKNLQQKESFSGISSSDTSEITYSDSSQAPNTSSYLISNISQKNFTSLLDSSKSLISLSSQIDIYNLSYSLNESAINLNLLAIEQSIKQSAFRMKLLTGITQQEKQMIKNIKKNEQIQLNHLICNYEKDDGQISVHSKKQLQVKPIQSQKSSQRLKYLKKLSSIYEPNVQEQDFLMENMPIQIKQRLGKQLNRYKLNSGKISVSSSRTNKSKKRVRDKAEEMLKELGLHYFQQ